MSGIDKISSESSGSKEVPRVRLCGASSIDGEAQPSALQNDTVCFFERALLSGFINAARQLAQDCKKSVNQSSRSFADDDTALRFRYRPDRWQPDYWCGRDTAQMRGHSVGR